MSLKCDTENEELWINNPKALFCSLSPIPKGSAKSGTRFNAITRLIVYITLALIALQLKSKYIMMFVIGALVILIVIYYYDTNNKGSKPMNATEHASTTNMKEGFNFLPTPPITPASGSPFGTTYPPNYSGSGFYNYATVIDGQEALQYSNGQAVLDNNSNGQRILRPQVQVPVQAYAQAVREPTADNQLRLLPTKSSNLSNNFLGQSREILNVVNEPGNRDSQAGIQYFTPKVGVNPKTNIPPIIAPRITDIEVWGDRSTVPQLGNINKATVTDITNMDINVTDMAGMATNQPWSQGYKHAYPLGLPVEYQYRQPGAVWDMNPIGAPVDIGYYPSSTDMWNYNNINDVDRNVLPLYSNANNFVVPNIQEEAKMYKQFTQQNATPNYNPWDQAPKNLSAPPTQVIGVTQQDVALQSGAVPFPSAAPSREGFAFPKQLAGYVQQPAAYPLEASSANGTKGVLGGAYSEMNRVPPGQDVQIPAVTSQLMYQSPVYSYTDAYFNQPNTNLFLQDVQPQLYSYAVDQQPINSSVGISYAPQNPPRVLDQVVNNGMAMPLYSRVDPQLVRKDGTPGQQSSQPTRSDWSAEYSNFQAPQGSINFEDIYDPRFTSYGDPYRSYSDVNLGQIQYYYSDIDSYRMPNFISRTNVDFVDFRNPNGEIWPYYVRDTSIDDVRSHVESQTTADELYHREDMMSLQMDKANRIRWQQRFAPLDNNHSFRG